MFGIGTGEILLILVIAILVVGPEKMVEFSRQAGRLLAQFRQQTEGMTRDFREALALDEIQGALSGVAEEVSTTTDEVASVTTEAKTAFSPPSAATKSATPSSQASSPATPGAAAGTQFLDREVEGAPSGPPPIGSLNVIDDDDAAIELHVGELVPRDDEVEPTVIGDPILVDDEDDAETRGDAAKEGSSQASDPEAIEAPVADLAQSEGS